MDDADARSGRIDGIAYMPLTPPGVDETMRGRARLDNYVWPIAWAVTGPAGPTGYGVRQARSRSPGGAAMTPLCHANVARGVAVIESRDVAGTVQ